MKKSFLIIATLFCGYTSSSQTIIADCTDLSGECSYYTNNDIIVTNSEKKKGFTFCPSLEMKNGKLVCDGIIATLVNIGSCCEKNTLILLLEDSSKVICKSWNKFNCKGNAYFDLTRDDCDMLRTQKIIKAQMQNGYTYDSFQNSIPASNQSYFIKFFKNVDANEYISKK